jgi:hypothetical protein
LNDHAAKNTPNGHRVLVLTKRVVKSTAGATFREFYDFNNLQACNFLGLRRSLAEPPNKLSVAKEADVGLLLSMICE